jgi:hypothetical protein
MFREHGHIGNIGICNNFMNFSILVLVAKQLSILR